MNERFTVEEMNLMCIFLSPPNGLGRGPGDTSGRGRLIAEITAAVGDCDTGDPQSDAEVREIAANTIAKLLEMSNADFATLELWPEYGAGFPQNEVLVDESNSDYYEMED